jgi:hypothetical protein
LSKIAICNPFYSKKYLFYKKISLRSKVLNHPKNSFLVLKVAKPTSKWKNGENSNLKNRIFGVAAHWKNDFSKLCFASA